MYSPLAFVVTSATDRDEHMAAQVDSWLSNWRASLSRSLATDVSVGSPIEHRPCSRQVTEWMECNFVIYQLPRIYHKATNAAVCCQLAIKHICKNDSSLIIFTMRDIVLRNYVSSQKIPRFDKAWKILSIFVFATHIFSSSNTHTA